MKKNAPSSRRAGKTNPRNEISGEPTPKSVLETFANPHPDRAYLITHRVQEFTSLCPKTGQPDFARVMIRYVAGGSCVELKSLKLYLQTFRDRGIFYEAVTNEILSDLVAACRPKWMQVETKWSVRGGIRSVIVAEHGRRMAHDE